MRPIRTVLTAGLTAILLAVVFERSAAAFEEAKAAAAEIEEAMELTPNRDRGTQLYAICAVCHEPEGWGREDGYYPQIAGQHHGVLIKQLADIRARNRDNPTMFPFTMRRILADAQDVADVSVYVARLPMTPGNGVGPGTDLAHGERLYKEHCVKCHGENGEGDPKERIPLIQGQHYEYLVRQFEWIRTGKRRNADEKMVKQIEGFSPRDVSAQMDYVSRLKPPPDKLAGPGWRNPDFPNYVRK